MHLKKKIRDKKFYFSNKTRFFLGLLPILYIFVESEKKCFYIKQLKFDIPFLPQI